MKTNIPLRAVLPHSIFFENWNYDTPDTRGIGNSETAQIQLSRHLAMRGWEVINYAPIPEGTAEYWQGTRWLPLEKIDYSLDGYWLIWRTPELLDHFPKDHPGKLLCLVSEDESYGARWTDERIDKLDILFALCEAHRRNLEKDHPALKGKVKIGANGIRMELIRAVDADPPERDPHRIMWASSPDRGLLKLLKIFRRVRQLIPDATLYATYGFENINKLLERDPAQFAWMKREKEAILKAAEQPGVHWLGRIPQPQLMYEWAKTAVIAYPSLFKETFCTTHCEAQALGAIPVTSGVWALGEHACGGSVVAGDPNDPLVEARYVAEIFRWLSNPELQEAMRGPMMEVARIRYRYARTADYYESELLGFADRAWRTHQFAFQLKHTVGHWDSVLNVGCADDPAEFGAHGGVNLDLREEDPIFHKPTKAHILADCRTMPGCLDGRRFDRVVLGDILEHFPVEQVPDILRRAAVALHPGGKIVVTVPDDDRPVDQQHATSDGTHEYVDGVSAVHTHRITQSDIAKWSVEAGLYLDHVERTEQNHYGGWGVVFSVEPGPRCPYCGVLEDHDCAESPSKMLDRIDQILAEFNEPGEVDAAV